MSDPSTAAPQSPPEEPPVDVLIVGAGPVGLFAVFACGQLEMRCAVVDALPDIGGQLTALYPEKPIYDIPGQPEIRADALVEALTEQAAPYAPRYVLGEKAVSLSEDSEGVFELGLDSGRRLRGRALILATGPGAFGPNKPPLDGIEAYEGESVFYHVARRDRFLGARVVIAGGGDSAVDWAVSLAEVAESVSVVHRRDRFRAAPAMVAQMRADPRITLHTGRQLAGLSGEPPRLSAVRIAAMNGESEDLPADALIALFGLATDLSPLVDWGVRVAGKSAPVSPATCETSRAGVYAIGDLADYPGKRKLILSGFAEAAMAAESAYARLHEGRRPHFEHSTSRGAPGRETTEAASDRATGTGDNLSAAHAAS